MSKALANASRLKPEIRLAQAVSQFEAGLSDKQKSDLHILKSQSLKSPPDPSDVMRLTAEMDRQMSRKAGGRCFGPRFTNFLHGVQQFAALGDVIVGGSQNIIACGVWSLVRMSLLSIVSVASYIEKLSILFMDIGRSAPRYQSMALLYPESKNLQSQLCEYFIVVVSLCRHLFSFAQRSVFRQATSALNDLDLKTFQTDLDRWANSIKEEMIVTEARENSRFRVVSRNLSKTAAYQQALATKLRVLDFCSKYDHETAWKRIRKIGNTTLFTQLPGYQEWKDSSTSCTLLCTGKLGSGKSVLLANIVDDVNVDIKSNNVTVAYFFCRYDLPESLMARTILGSLARQLLRTIPDLVRFAEVCEETQSTEDTEKMLDLICHSFLSGRKTYFILDGLDECDRAERELVAQSLKKILQTLKLRLLISYRVEPNKGSEPVTKLLEVTWNVSIPEQNPDIEAFVEAELDYCIESKKLVLGDPTLILTIQDALLKGSQGMFLWVALQIQTFCDMKTDQDIRDALEDLPKDLSETFSRILRKARELGPSYQMKILHLVVAACRPLTAGEMREALSVVPGDTVWTPSRLLNDVHSALACCGCLLIVDEEENTIHFVHNSVKQFLLNSFDDSINIAFIAEHAQRTMADIIVTYLSYGVFGTELSKTKVPPVMIRSAPSSIVRTAVGSSSTAQNIALKLLRARRRPDFDISKILAEARKPFQSNPLEEFRFYSYATVHWQQHRLYVSGGDPTIFGLSVKLISPGLYEANSVTTNLTEIAWAADNGNEAIVKLLIDSGKLNASFMNQDGRPRLHQAAWYGHERIVQLLLGTSKINIDVQDQAGLTPLYYAAINGHKEMVKLLLSTGNVNVDVQDKAGLTPLYYAAINGHEEIVKLLIGTGKADVNVKSESGESPLMNAVMERHEEMVKLLLSTGKVNVSARDHYGLTPLWYAAVYGDENIVKLLLGTGKVDIDEKGQDGRTPLWQATKHRHQRVVKLLLENGANIAIANYNSQTLLSMALADGHIGIIKLLLRKGANMADPYNDGHHF